MTTGCSLHLLFLMTGVTCKNLPHSDRYASSVHTGKQEPEIVDVLQG